MRICNDGRTWPDTTAAEFRRLVEEHARTDYPCQEWHVAGSWHGVGRCLACGRPVKNGAYVIRHAGTGDTLGPIGPSCVRPFEHGHAASDVADLCELVQRRLRQLQILRSGRRRLPIGEGVVGPGDCRRRFRRPAHGGLRGVRQLLYL